MGGGGGGAGLKVYFMPDSPSAETAVFEGHGFESRPDHLPESRK